LKELKRLKLVESLLPADFATLLRQECRQVTGSVIGKAGSGCSRLRQK
jgi:hypothetical protein